MTASDRLLTIPALKHADLSPDGTAAIVTVGVVAPDADEEAFELLEISTTDGATSALPGAVAGDRYGVWSADGARVAWLSDRTGSTQVVVLDVASGAARVVSNLPAGVSGPVEWSPDGTRLVVAAPARADDIDRTRPYRITRPVPRFDTIGWLDDAPQLWLVEVAIGPSDDVGQRLLTDDGWRWGAPAWSADGSAVLAVANMAPDALGRATEVRVVQLDGSWRVADVPRCENAVACWGADGSVVVIPARIAGEGTARKKDIWVEQLGGSPQCRTAGFAVGVGGAVYGDHAAWLSDTVRMAVVPGSTDVLVRFAHGGRHGIARVALEGAESVTPVAMGDRCLSLVSVVDDLALVVTETSTSPCELALLTISTGDVRTFTDFAAGAVAPIEVHRFSATSDTGPAVEAWFLAPAGSQAPLPTVVMVHGGPEAAFGEAFSIDAHVLCDAGFGVLYCNPRGSTGYGSEFSMAAIGEWGNGPVDDVFAVVDRAVGLGLVDASRLGITGNSFGGWMTSWLACTSDRFRAAVAENPVTDLLSMSFTSDIGPEFMTLSMGGDVSTSLERYLRWSPLLQAHRCGTPTLFVVGDHDDRVPFTQAKELAAALHRQRVPTEILVLPGATHEGSSFGPVPCRRAHNAALVDWMERWVLAAGQGETAMPNETAANAFGAPSS